jgi:hypothetical protein
MNPDNNPVGKIRLQLKLVLDFPVDNVLEEHLLYKIFDKEDFLAPPAKDMPIWILQGKVTAHIDRIVLEPEAPLAGIRCSAERPIRKELFDELIANGWAKVEKE